MKIAISVKIQKKGIKYMKRWKVTFTNGNKILLYYESKEKLAEIFKTNPVKSIDLYDDIFYLPYIGKIKSSSKLIYAIDCSTFIEEYYKCKYNKGELVIRLSKDKTDNKYYDIAEYQENEVSIYTLPITYTLSTPKEVWKIINEPNLEYIVYSHRYYGEPKLSKPKELKGIKSIGSAIFIPKKCNPQIFVNGNDIYIKHTDYFSCSWQPPKGERINKGQSYYMNKYFDENRKEKFIYTDNYADIVLRNDAWILLRNSIQVIKSTTNHLDFTQLVLQQQKKDKYTQFTTNDSILEWRRFWEDVYTKVDNYLIDNNG